MEKGGIDMIDYENLWQFMKDHKISQYYLIQHGIGNKTIYNLKKGCHISTATLEKLCNILNCTPNDIIAFIPDPQDKKQ